uniref:Cadherin domain-containing protein n=1 Tax=Sus scrofa TaxID=9823 RepID=A0A8D1G0Y9_PIG
MVFSWRGGFESRRLLLSLLLLAAWEAGSGQVRYSVPEEAKHGTFVGRIAQDLGLELAELVPRLFRMASKGGGDLLVVNLQNGILFVNSRIDREELCGRSLACSIHLEVIVERPLQVFHVEVEVKDINDNPPVFREGEQKVLISESAPLDSRFPLEGASDADIGLNSLLTYRLSLNEYFTLKVVTKTDKSILPELILRKSLDREEMPELTILLTALDGGKPELTGSVQIQITILDVNDNAPEFDKPSYKVVLFENVPNDTRVIQLNASDLDEGPNREISYGIRMILPVSEKRMFSINSETGEIRIYGKLDFEENNEYEIQVNAVDKGIPSMAGHCTVLVEVLDLNDNTPEVMVTSLSLPVREDAQMGTVIALISVSDRDSGANGQVTCSLAPQVPFKLVSTFKNYYSLVLDSTLDRESVASYELVVSARDGGSPSLWATARVSVEVGDVNDNAPVFAQPEYTVFVKENNAPGCHIFTVSARDADAQENARVAYSLVERRVGERALSSYVSVHAESGQVFALQPLDREELELLQFRVSARDAGSAFNGTLVIKLNATDPDDGTNADIIYSFRRPVSPAVLYAFSINSDSGEIRTKGKLDFEERKLYEISVEAIDKGNIPMAGHCTILVEIVDVNDNAPEVTITSLALPIQENAQVGTVIALISVSDRDSGANGQVTCSLMPHSPFKLVSTFKNYYSLVLDGTLDRESVASYELVVSARDGGSPSLWATARVSVEVGDVNDNAPVFAQPEYTVFVKENNAPGCHIFTVSARDADAQENARVAYSLVERRVGERALSSYVSVHAESGQVFALQPLDREELELLQFRVSARDAGAPPLGSNVTLQVFVLDENDNAPALLPPPPPSQRVARWVGAGQVVAKVRAVDADSGYNAWLSYELQEAAAAPGGARSAFRVGLYTGEISTTRALDEADAARQRLLVLVKDHGEPALTATATVLLWLEDGGAAPKASSRLVVGPAAAAAEAALVDVHVYLVVAICAVSSLLVLTLLVYTALRCSAPRGEGACVPGQARLVCSSAVGSWSSSPRRWRRQRQRVCSGEGPPKADLMAFSPSLPPCLNSAEGTGEIEAGSEDA